MTSVVEPEERAAEQDVVASGQVLVEPRTERQQARHVAADVDRALGRMDDPGEHLEERALARAVRPDDGERLPALDAQVTWRSAQNCSTWPRPRPARSSCGCRLSW